MVISFFFPSIDSSSGRAQRNQAEKNRRDKLNKSVQQLGEHVKDVAGGSKRVDKTAILRLSAHGLRVEYGKRTFNFRFHYSQLYNKDVRRPNI